MERINWYRLMSHSPVSPMAYITMVTIEIGYMLQLTIVINSLLHYMGENLLQFLRDVSEKKTNFLTFIVYFCGGSMFIKKQNKGCGIFMMEWMALLSCPVEYEIICLYLCLCDYTICGKAYFLVSYYERLSRAGFFLPQYESKNYFNLFSSMRKDKCYLLYIPDETLIYFDN